MLKIYFIQMTMIVGLVSVIGLLPTVSDMLSNASMGTPYLQTSRAPTLSADQYAMAVSDE